MTPMPLIAKVTCTVERWKKARRLCKLFFVNSVLLTEHGAAWSDAKYDRHVRVARRLYRLQEGGSPWRTLNGF